MKRTKNGFTLVESFMVVGILALFVAIAIPNLLRSRVSANDTKAQAALKVISVALENYLAINSIYPSTTNDLLVVTPPYLNTDFFTGDHDGFTFTVDALGLYNYTVTAIPLSSSVGTGSFTLSTGGIITKN